MYQWYLQEIYVRIKKLFMSSMQIFFVKDLVHTCDVLQYDVYLGDAYLRNPLSLYYQVSSIYEIFLFHPVN